MTTLFVDDPQSKILKSSRLLGNADDLGKECDDKFEDIYIGNAIGLKSNLEMFKLLC